MKRTLLTLAIVGAMSAASVPATAAQIAGPIQYTNQPNIYLGSYNPMNEDFAVGLFHTFGAADASFTDYYIFDISPDGFWTGSANFNPNGAIADFNVFLADVTGATCGMIGVACTGMINYANQVPGNTGNAASTIDFSFLTAGRYALIVTGDPSATSQYTGQMNTRPVPEPGTLALAGAALLGAVALRRRKTR